MDERGLKERTKQFALRVIRLVDALQKAALVLSLASNCSGLEHLLARINEQNLSLS